MHGDDAREAQNRHRKRRSKGQDSWVVVVGLVAVVVHFTAEHKPGHVVHKLNLPIGILAAGSMWQVRRRMEQPTQIRTLPR